jgi:citrate lyase subunit beta/citryl-CoA lyase
MKVRATTWSVSIRSFESPSPAPRVRRSLLYVPASNPRAMAKARGLACDVVVIDLEDSVSPEAKADARLAAAAAIRERAFGEREVMVRVNALDSEWGVDDFGALIPLWTEIAAVVAPKVADVQDVQRYTGRLMAAPDRVVVIAMIETCRAALYLESIVATRRVGGVILGLNDLAADMGARPGPDREPFQAVMSRAVIAARAGRKLAFDGVCNAFDDDIQFERELRQARAFGFDGKTLIHPNQIGPCNRAFSPTPEEVAWAREVVEAFAAAGHLGAVRVGGKMVERMHLDQARKILAHE